MPNKYPQDGLQVKCEWKVTISWLLCDLSHRYSLLPAVWNITVRKMWVKENYSVITADVADLAKLDSFVRKCTACIFFISLSTCNINKHNKHSDTRKTTGNKCSQSFPNSFPPHFLMEALPSLYWAVYDTEWWNWQFVHGHWRGLCQIWRNNFTESKKLFLSCQLFQLLCFQSLWVPWSLWNVCLR